MKITKLQRNNLILFVFILILIIPQTRQPLQILLHKGLSMFSPSVIESDKRTTLNSYQWKLVNENGESFDFNEAKGKVVVLNFWATWCPPCIAEMPHLEDLYSDYKDKVLFLLVSSETPEIVAKFKAKHDYDFKVYSSVSEVPKELETTAIPRSFILDKNGTIAIDKTGAANWNSDVVRKLLDDLLKAK
ncbi:MAG: TlpA disulfide reductase family protein [Aquaticitalea sp.]